MASDERDLGTHHHIGPRPTHTTKTQDSSNTSPNQAHHHASLTHRDPKQKLTIGKRVRAQAHLLKLLSRGLQLESEFQGHHCQSLGTPAINHHVGHKHGLNVKIKVPAPPPASGLALKPSPINAFRLSFTVPHNPPKQHSKYGPS